MNSATSSVNADLLRVLSTLSSTQPLTALAPPELHPRPDPRAITTLLEAREYIYKHLLNDDFSAAVRRLIEYQHQRETHWHLRRREIVKRHASRPETEARLKALFESIGTVPSGNVESEEEELRRFDMEVWDKCKAMVGEITTELGKLGVPGFIWEAGPEFRQGVIRILEDLCEEKKQGK